MLRLLLALPLLLVLALFALSNTQHVQFALWPTDLSVDMPLSIAILSGMAVAFVLGALILWFSMLAARARARRAEQTMRLLEAQLAELRAELVTLRRNTPATGASQKLITWRG